MKVMEILLFNWKTYASAEAYEALTNNFPAQHLWMADFGKMKPKNIWTKTFKTSLWKIKEIQHWF